MTLTVEEIRKAYPHPQGWFAGNEETDYCVGGALICYMKRQFTPKQYDRFPKTTPLAFYLMKANPALSKDRAITLASMIIGANDRGDFARAWSYLDRALPAGTAIDIEPEPEQEAVCV